MHLLNNLLNNNNDKVIIIQGDHGPSAISDLSLKKSLHKLNLTKFRFNILNAYYVPDSIKTKLYRSISPVNSFRIILSSILKKDIPLLRDNTYWIKDQKHINVMIND